MAALYTHLYGSNVLVMQLTPRVLMINYLQVIFCFRWIIGHNFISVTVKYAYVRIHTKLVCVSVCAACTYPTSSGLYFYTYGLVLLL